eukprot:3718003-Lingulodinium_polyedra.AAC.1
MASLRGVKTLPYEDVRNILDACAVVLDWNGVTINAPARKAAASRLQNGAQRLRSEALVALKG